jgi:C-terminal processing protease CtpA/Prc
VTDDLQAVHKDGHLRLFAPDPAATAERPRRLGPQPDDAIGKSGWLADGVAYIDFRGFPGDPATLQRLRAFLDQHAAAKTLIIDARRHGGGGLAEMDLMFPLFFGEKQTLVQMDTRSAVEERHGSPLPEGPTLVRADGPKEVVRRSHLVIPAAQANGLRSAKIYLLTSKRTGSAAEHMALSLKRTGRATLIGESTAGAGHFGGMAPMGDKGYLAFIPVGRTFDPATNEGWEGVGVKPHVEVPADGALDEALKRAGVQPGAAKTLASL